MADLRRDSHRAKKSLGQNFLIDPNLQRKIVEALAPSPDDEVLEIGPGHGALTSHLAGTVRRLILVEIDRDLASHLATKFADRPSIVVLSADILETSLDEVAEDPARLKVIGNIPYNITTPIIFHLLERRPRPTSIVLTVQREVADRLLARPGGKEFGALAVGVQSVASIERITHVGRYAFRPIPDVESTVIRITPFQPPPLDQSTEQALRSLSRTAFGMRRKQFQRILRDALSLSAEEVGRLGDTTGLDLSARPETFDALDFIRLTRALIDAGHPPP
ncbi:MAG: 16S rRNA (adenine(1518)-N(6)/adenine(1519)-N(6))-dimethyltransferase RsmA [Gemmatimonadota bacterium]